MAIHASRLILTLALTGGLLALESCGPAAKPESRKNVAGQDTPETPVSKPAEEVPEPPASEPLSEPGKKITRDDYDTLAAFGEAYAKAMSEGNEDAAAAAWNYRAFVEIVMGDSEQHAPKFVQGIRRSFVSSLENGQTAVGRLNFDQPWRVLRVREVAGETRILCRVSPDSGLIYFELIPRLDADGNPEIVDIYAYAHGEKLSQTLRRVFLPRVAKAAEKPVEALISGPDPLGKYGDQFLAIGQALREENYAGVIEQFRKASPELQEEKNVLLMYLGSAARLMAAGENAEAEAAHLDGVKRFQKSFGDDPAFLLMGLDYHFLQEDYEAASKAIDRLDKAVGGDPYLDFFRASVLLSQEKFKEALPLAEKARDSNPELEDPYWGIVNIQLVLEDYEAVAEGLDQLAEKFDYEFELGEDPAYEAFLKSPAGKAWVEKQKDPPAGN